MTGKPGIVSAIYRWHENKRGNQGRPHLGASMIGHECLRYLWLNFRFADHEHFNGRKLRLFETGFLAEERFEKELRGAGFEVEFIDPLTNKQFQQHTFGGHFGGSMDGKIKLNGRWDLLEFKTHNEKSFIELTVKGVKSSKPTHYAQMQVYMGLGKMVNAHYLSVNKNTDELYHEQVPFNKDAFSEIVAKADHVVFAKDKPLGISENPTYWKCKLCSMHDMCFKKKHPKINCRTCKFVRPKRDGTWGCEKYPEKPIPFEFQKKGCDKHLYNKSLVPYKPHNEVGLDNYYVDEETGVIFVNIPGKGLKHAT